MIPLNGRPFLAHVLDRLVQAGFRSVVMILGPGQEEVRDFLRSGESPRIPVGTLVQERPLGTAHAVATAEDFAAGEPAVFLNGDNLYPAAGLAALRQLGSAGLLGFRRSTLLRQGNIAATRINSFALIDIDGLGHLTRIAEKPGPEQAAGFGNDPLVSMNAWLLPATIYPACREIRLSPRGELELQDAVRRVMERRTERFTVLECPEGVLDLTTPADILEVERRLRAAAASS